MDERLLVNCQLAGQKVSFRGISPSYNLFLIKVNCSDIFKRIPTDSGMCCALNPGEALRESKYRELVRDMQGEGNATGEVEEVKSQVGKMNGLRLTLDLHSNSVSFGSLEHDYNAFNVFIGQRAEFPILKEKSLQLQPGQEVMPVRYLKFS